MTAVPGAVGGVGVVVVGVGNEYRRDDGVGPVTVRRLGSLVAAGTRLCETDGEPVRLLESWAGARLAVILDAVACHPSHPGRIHRLEVDAVSAPVGSTGRTSHGLGLPEAVALAAALDRLPDRLVVLTVEAADLGQGVGLSAPVAAAVPELLRRVRAELAG